MAPQYTCPTCDSDKCGMARLTVQDILDVVGGEWKLILSSTRRDGKLRFSELAREAGISPRILSKELQELEMHGLISRTVYNTQTRYCRRCVNTSQRYAHRSDYCQAQIG